MSEREQLTATPPLRAEEKLAHANRILEHLRAQLAELGLIGAPDDFYSALKAGKVADA